MDQLKPFTPDELRQAQDVTNALSAVATVLKCKWQDIPASIKKVQDEITYLKEEITRLKEKPCKSM